MLTFSITNSFVKFGDKSLAGFYLLWRKSPQYYGLFRAVAASSRVIARQYKRVSEITFSNMKKVFCPPAYLFKQHPASSIRQPAPMYFIVSLRPNWSPHYEHEAFFGQTSTEKMKRSYCVFRANFKSTRSVPRCILVWTRKIKAQLC